MAKKKATIKANLKSPMLAEDNRFMLSAAQVLYLKNEHDLCNELYSPLGKTFQELNTTHFTNAGYLAVCLYQGKNEEDELLLGLLRDVLDSPNCPISWGGQGLPSVMPEATCPCCGNVEKVDGVSTVNYLKKYYLHGPDLTVKSYNSKYFNFSNILYGGLCRYLGILPGIVSRTGDKTEVISERTGPSYSLTSREVQVVSRADIHHAMTKVVYPALGF